MITMPYYYYLLCLRNLWAEPCSVGSARVPVGRARVGAHLLLAEDTCVPCNLAQWRPRGAYRPVELRGPRLRHSSWA